VVIYLPISISKIALELMDFGLKHCHVTNGHVGGSHLLSQFYHSHILIEIYPDTLLEAAIGMIGPILLKKNTFYVVSVHLAIMDLFWQFQNSY
jgi:hypothetical protein